MEVMTSDDSFNVRWSNHHRAIAELLDRLYADESYTDCSLAADGEEISAHKLILSACSPFLNNILKKHAGKHPVIVLRDVSFEDLKAVVEYIYKGEVSLSQEKLTSFLKAAEMLSVTGLTSVHCEKKRPRRSSPKPYKSPKRSYRKEAEPAPQVEEDAFSFTMEEYLSDDVDKNEEKENEEDYKLIVVDEGGEMKELGQVFTDETTGEFETDIDSILKASLGEDTEIIDIPPQLSRGRTVKRKEYNVHCQKCGGLYKHESSYYNHLRNDCAQIHSCNTCSKCFKNRRHLLDHVRDDCGRVHYCPNCNRAFRQKVNLTTHQKHYCKPKRRVIEDSIFSVGPK